MITDRENQHNLLTDRDKIKCLPNIINTTPHYMDSSTKSPPPIGHVFFSGLNEPCSVRSIVEVVINTQGGDNSAPGEVQVYATSPIGLKRLCDVTRRENSFTTTFTPDRIGKWLISILYEGEHIHGSPFTCYVFDASLVRVSGLDVGLVGKELRFTVDATRAGQGEAKVNIVIDGHHLPVIIHEEPQGSGMYRVLFTPQGPGKYEIHVNFNKQSVKGSPYILDIADSTAISVYGDQLQMATVDRLSAFFIQAASIESRDITCIITGPNGKKKYARVIPLDETTFKAEWKPIETGEHLIEVLIYDRPSTETPFTCQVGDPDQVIVRRMPQQIEAQNLNKKHTFEIDATAAGSGNLEIVINDGRVACHVRETTSRHFLAEFTPVQEVRHNIEMRFNNEHVRGSPWSIPFLNIGSASPITKHLPGYDVRKRAEEFAPYDEREDIITELIGAGLNRAAVGIPTHFDIRSNTRLGVNNIFIRIVNVENGRLVENVRLSEHALGTVRCEYVLPTVSDYEIIVNINGRRVDAEPLIIAAFDPRAVRVRLKEDVDDYRPGKPAQFIVDAAEAGKGQLEISVNQGQVPNNVQMQDAGRCLVTFIPQHAGTYVINVTFNGLQVHGCPIKVDVRERQVGKPVSAPVYPHATTATAYGISPTTRGPSSAYYSSTSPRLLDTTTISASSYAPSPSSPPHPRSPPLMASIGASTGVGTELRSPALVKQQQQQPKGLLGYTVAQYGSKDKIVERETKTTQVTTTIAGSSPADQQAILSPRQHRYFGEPTPPTPAATPITPPSHHPPAISSQPLKAESAQFEMTRSAELTLFRERPPQSTLAAQSTMASRSVTTTTTTMEERREIPIQHIYDRVPEEREHFVGEPVSSKTTQETIITAPTTTEFVTQTHKQHDLPYAPLDPKVRKTLEILRTKDVSGQELEITTGRIDMTPTPIAVVGAPATAVITSPATVSPQIQTHIVEPYSSDIETAMTPGTRRRLLEHTVYKAADLTETEGRSAVTDQDDSEPPTSRPSSKATTPRLSLKFRGSKEKQTASAHGEGGFDWGKSKISSKHEVVRRGKDVDVRIEALKLSKDDQLRVVVMPPQMGRQQQPVDQPAQQPPELTHKSKKTGAKSWEISFRPTEVGTHKVLVFVNNIPHPQAPFPIRVYDASQIVVGDIVRESTLNDTVEFTVDAGRAGFGNLEMAIKDHDGIIIPSHVSQLEAGAAKFLVTFTPSSTGTHTVHITFNKEMVKGSPFEVHIVEPPVLGPDGSPMPIKKKKEKKSKKEQNGTHSKSSSRETGSSIAGGTMATRAMVSKLPSLSRVDRPVELLVTLPKTEDLVQAQVHDLDRESLPVEVIQEGSHTRKIVFTPKRVGDHEVDIRIGGVEVEGSPFTCRAYDPTKIIVGEIPDGAVERPVSFVVDASQAGVGNLEVAVNDGKIPSMAHSLGQHKYEITFVPKEPVDHQISVRFNNEPVTGSPFICRLVQTGQFAAPTSAAVASAMGAVASTMTPTISSRSPFTASGVGLERIPVGEVAEFFVDSNSTDGQPTSVVESLPKVQITDPRGELLPVDIAAYNDETTRAVVRYTPRSVGNHQISIKWNGQPIAGSPFTAKAFDANSVKLALDAECGQVGRACTFTIDAAKAGAGNMEIIVSVGKKNVPNYVQPEGPARFRVSFTPQQAQEHLISVKFNGVSVPGSPLRTSIVPAPPRSPRPSRGEISQIGAQPASSTTQEQQSISAVVQREDEEEQLRLVGDLASAQLGQPKRFSIEAPPGQGRVDCNVVVIDSQGSPLPVRCYKQQDESYWVEFTPEVCGPHRIEVTFGDEPIHGSPFHCEVVDPKQVQVNGIERPFSLRTIAHFVVKRNAAGTGPLNVNLVDPQGELVKMERVKNSAGDDSFTFLPTKLGAHKLHVKLAGFTSPGSPFSLVVEEQRVPTVYGAAMDYAIERGQQASMIFDANKQPGGLKVEVQNPEGGRIRHTTNRRPDECTEIAFRPQEVGYYEVHIDFNNRPIHGSPFRVTVVDPTKVIVNDQNFGPDGMLKFIVGERNLIDVDATAAGPVKLRAEIRDSEGELLTGEGQQINVHSLGYGKFQLTCTPRRIGKYKIYVYCSELVVPGAYPLLAIAEQTKTTAAALADVMVDGAKEPLMDVELKKVILRGDGLIHARLREQAEFIVDASELRRGEMGKCTATLHGERADVPVKLSALRNQVYKGVYTPLVEGTYQLSVLINSKHVLGSPSTVRVESHLHPVELIEVDARPLKMGIIGEDVRTVIDARRAGPGQISAQCAGPTQAEYCELLDNRDGTYLLRVQPKELGKHTLSIRYENEHVRDSPFVFNVNNPPDPSKVKVYGPGIEHGILHSFKSDFVVDTKGAGAGQLTVRVRGPKGAFNVEMQRDREQERTIHCKYEPREPGDYQVEVKWHGQHVPGSPFFVLIVDTEQELQRFLAGGAPSPTPPSPFVPPGWLPSGPPALIPGGPHPAMLPMPPPHLAHHAIGGRVTPGSATGMIVPMHHPPPPQHYAIGPPAVVPGRQPIYGKHQ